MEQTPRVHCLILTLLFTYLYDTDEEHANGGRVAGVLVFVLSVRNVVSSPRASRDHIAHVSVHVCVEQTLPFFALNLSTKPSTVVVVLLDVVGPVSQICARLCPEISTCKSVSTGPRCSCLFGPNDRLYDRHGPV